MHAGERAAKRAPILTLIRRQLAAGGAERARSGAFNSPIECAPDLSGYWEERIGNFERFGWYLAVEV